MKLKPTILSFLLVTMVGLAAQAAQEGALVPYHDGTSSKGCRQSLHYPKDIVDLDDAECEKVLRRDGDYRAVHGISRAFSVEFDQIRKTKERGPWACLRDVLTGVIPCLYGKDSGLEEATKADPSKGTIQLSSGSVIVLTSRDASSIRVTYNTPAAPNHLGFLSAPAVARVPGQGFVINSTSGTGGADTSTVDWVLGSADGYNGGTATLVNGTVTIKTTNLRSPSIITMTYNTRVSTDRLGFLSAPAASRVPGQGFVINSTSKDDNSTVDWAISQPSSGGFSGTATLANGIVRVQSTAIRGDTSIQLTYNTPASSDRLGFLSAPATARIIGQTFVILSNNVADTSTVDWVLS